MTDFRIDPFGQNPLGSQITEPEGHIISFQTNIGAYGFWIQGSLNVGTDISLTHISGTDGTTIFTKVEPNITPAPGQFRVDAYGFGRYKTFFIQCNSADDGKLVVPLYENLGANVGQSKWAEMLAGKTLKSLDGASLEIGATTTDGTAGNITAVTVGSDLYAGKLLCTVDPPAQRIENGFNRDRDILFSHGMVDFNLAGDDYTGVKQVNGIIPAETGIVFDNILFAGVYCVTPGKFAWFHFIDLTTGAFKVFVLRGASTNDSSIYFTVISEVSGP